MPLARTASATSSVMSRTLSPPLVRTSVWRWNTFTAPSSSSVGRLRTEAYSEGSGRLRHGPTVSGGLGGGWAQHALHRALLIAVAALVRRRPARGRVPCGHPAPGRAADREGGLHPVLAVAVDGAVDLVGALLEVHRQGRRPARLDVARLLLGPVALDHEGVGDLAVVLDVEGVGAGLRDADRLRRDRELLLR